MQNLGRFEWSAMLLQPLQKAMHTYINYLCACILLIDFLCLCKGLIIYLVLGVVQLLIAGPEDFRFYGCSLQGLIFYSKNCR